MQITTHRRILTAACLAGALLFLAIPGVRLGAQQEAAPPQAQQPIRVETTLVNLFVTVRDKHGAIVPNLNKDDFHIFEGGTEQKIAVFSRDVSLPITLGLLLDTSGSEQETLGFEKEALSSFIRQVLRKNDLAMLITFDSNVDLLADFTDDTSIFDRAIQRARVNVPSGATGPLSQSQQVGTAFYDAIYLACHDQLSTQAGRKAIVAVTDANDEGSRLRIQDAIEAAQRADAVVHILLVIDPHYGGNPGAAHKLADDTGGRVIDVHRGRDIQKAFDEISEELRSQYTLGYYPTNSAHDGSFRKIKVETKDSGMKVLARKGYYAPKN
jgi:VWFA-related protein